MATNANANGIPFLKRTGIPPAIKNSMVVYYDIKKQGCTNESMKANPLLKDLSGNGHDATCYNFAWNCESGIGEFVFKKFNTNNNITVKENTITFNFTPDISILKNNIGYTHITFDTPATKIKVNGIKDGIKGIYYYRNSEGIEEMVELIKDGIYNFPKSFNTVQNDTPNAGSSTGIRFDNPNKATAVITIEQLDYYKDAICTDGVDDYISSDMGIFQDGTIVFDADWSYENINCGINIDGVLSVYPNIAGLRIFIKHKFYSTICPRTIIATSTNDKIYENNMNVITNSIEHSPGKITGKMYLGGYKNNVYTKMYLRRIAVFNRVLTADEIKYVYEKIFGCKLKTMEERVEDSIILHYDIAKQGATNDSMKSDPRLIDLSGHGYDAVLNNFAWTENSGINTTTYPNSLMFDGVDDYGVVEDVPIFMPEVGFTVIAKRKILDTGKYCVATCSPGTDKGAFIFEINEMGVYSFGKNTSLKLDETNRITYMTSKTYNGITINKGTDNSKAPLVIGRRSKTDNRPLKGPIYIFMLFNRDLTTEEIEFVKQKYFSD